jgi:arylformamidase
MAQAVFRDYDREALDREYNNRAKVADAAEWLARYTRDSERARAELTCRLDVAYGPQRGETLDAFLVSGSGRAPIHVFIHGGYWHLLDKADFSFVARAFVPAGVVTVVINYSLIPTVDMDELVRQCRASIAWIWRNAASLGGDPSRIYVSGHSAGGHLTTMLLTTDWTTFGAPLDVLKGAVGISGLYDLEPIRLCYLNDVLQLTADTANRNSPVELKPARSIPLVLAVGALEGPEYHRQTDDLASAWRERGLTAQVLDLRGHHHFSIVAELADAKSELTRAVFSQMGVA